MHPHIYLVPSSRKPALTSKETTAKMRTLSGALFLALLASTALAGLQNPSAPALQTLADLTRPDGQKHLAADYIPSSATYSEPVDKSGGGVAWRVQKDQDQHKSSVAHLINGLANNLPFSLLPVSQQQAKPAAKAAAGSESSSVRPASDSISFVKQNVASAFSPINPPSIPLAVRSPYLSTWLPSGSFSSATPPNHQGNGGYLYGQYPAFWTSSYGADGEFRLGWTGYIRINGKTYQWMGDGFGTLVPDGPNAQQLSMEYTATRSTFAFKAAGVKFTVTFMTPITPNDYLRQSLPLSYMHFELDPKTAKGKDIQMYTDIDERFVTGHDYDYENYPYNMQFINTNGTSMYLIQRNNPQVYTEYRQRAEWGSVAYAVKNTPGLSSRNNNNVVAQSEFLQKGNLTFDHGPVGGPDNSFAFSVNFSAPGAKNDLVFAIGHLRTPYVNYIKPVPGAPGKSYQQDRYGYWQTKYPNFNDAVSFFVNDFAGALAGAMEFDKMIRTDSQNAAGGGAVGDNYAAITELSVRQAMATIEITVSQDDTGAYNKSDTLIFLKEISSNGDMSTVDVIFPLFPLLSYLNPSLLRDLMKPIFEYTESGLYPNKWCVHDLGVYPNAFGHNDGNDEPMQVEESGNMILMTLNWAQLVGKKAAVPFLKAHYKIMQQWASFLISDSLVPAEQLSTDDFAGTLANQTDLAIKGIEGISAMGYIADLIGQTDDANSYHNTSLSYVKLWANYSISHDGSHLKLAYQADSSWGTLYNLYFDRLLNLRLVPKSIYNILDNWYPTVAGQYGVPLDSRHTWAKTDWQMFAAATAAKKSTRDLFINKLYKFVSNGRTDSPFTDLFETTTGDTPKGRPNDNDHYIHFLARPVVGGHAALMLRDKADEANGITQYQYGPEFAHKAVTQAQVVDALTNTAAADPAITDSTAAPSPDAAKRLAVHPGKKQVAFGVKQRH
ncbi:DUF1793-domain-containing protein [Tilletiaria anomala UBC 951]|uniref:DUF1793-domain-containing protein n=1 Tax=Tilletiaria anomala (strain ATCC 24038 / CBS 436.72 / UBC 951) TaxID=1037660 RepID=A0A066WJB5_TILAU|nr:DUF1793-domain-containing protein [Tilletiaria anomala UBC 951]KDN52653.1 DUF1793-domain-containing protein [Tilletiaria anomala UBC 951]